MKRMVLAITGASGSLYVPEFLKLAQAAGVEVHAVISDAGREVMLLETGLAPADLDPWVAAWLGFKDFTAPMASGSSRFGAMLVLPCTMGTLGAIANGISANLIHRAADVMLKEGRPLLLAVRETPFNRVHLQNMLKAQEAGAIICPPIPSFYHRPESLSEMARFVAARYCDLLGIPVEGMKRWGDEG
ncbi:MAG: UbiX family flavin prenyltransferase [Desulfobacteraceae bacterium]|nr:UbiX family flavin prenyltransferase [Desulfobacteraceae bacterium]